MAKVRIFFTLTLISSILLIFSCIGLFICLSTNAYKYDSLKDYATEFYQQHAEDIAEECAHMLHNHTYSYGMNEIRAEYDGTIFGIFMDTDSFSGKTDNYTNDIIYTNYYRFSKTSTTRGTIYKLDNFNGDNSVLIKVSVSPTGSSDNSYAKLYESRYNYVYAASISGFIFLTFTILMGVFARKAPALKSPPWVNKMPFPIYLLFGIIIIAIHITALYIVYITTCVSNQVYQPTLIAPVILLAIACCFFIGGIIRRFIAKRVYKELFVYRIGKRHGIMAQGLVLCVYCAVLIIAGAVLSHYVWDFAWTISLLLLCALWIIHVINIHRIDKAISDYCQGNWSVQTTHDPLLLGHINNNLYGLSASMQATVEKSVRNERTKTELITNVSHDIKTPLTSIINFTDLLKRGDLSEDARKEYLEVLSKNSSRMKKLIEDLIEASKAATGNIELHPVVCNIDTLLSQAVVEHEPDGMLRNLKYILIKEKEPMFITVDGEKLYRVFDNLLSNANKYSLPGSRIYVELLTDVEAHIRFKNITEDQITISPEELTERFVKGDMSRHSEGSGLGLAICKNLVELMGGRLEINIAGDQFMVELSFPLQD